eukprot:CAMPEP_0178695038 /NCGR_PEP_ID=MMETSP0699-20121125/8623_1 /TAXON_ID=265572 /ORGANISM="Extubocellulus spinifer, Strain CCMP396" /LENGTH=43 /DNA_ID= /DNA_START= /DNA_END= /DNA_ORIENTATION=
MMRRLDGPLFGLVAESGLGERQGSSGPKTLEDVTSHRAANTIV